jgi:hypothetical protein
MGLGGHLDVELLLQLLGEPAGQEKEYRPLTVRADGDALQFRFGGGRGAERQGGDAERENPGDPSHRYVSLKLRVILIKGLTPLRV